MESNSRINNIVEVITILFTLAFIVYLFISPVDLMMKIFLGGLMVWIKLQNFILKSKKKSVRIINLILYTVLVLVGLVWVLQTTGRI